MSATNSRLNMSNRHLPELTRSEDVYLDRPACDDLLDLQQSCAKSPLWCGEDVQSAARLISLARDKLRGRLFNFRSMKG